ncbi:MULTISPECIES: glycosyltransferase family 4 protein [Roseobacteraceae]|uniref:Alpha-D-kanosaminyltransferase n=1 Tax=Pseudosulfitobacter pseudonitzschiae TaxID=1402135 RepID=A0A221JWI3_9RHOB|nr:alpha-D-kanosaminyltransferase [Pseudosulfitobacter pseudonitzschiae]
MTVAVYAPLKAPDHPVPSGDRAMARALIAALELGGNETQVVSGLRIYDGRGDANLQADLMAKAQFEADRLLASDQAAGWTHWLTYHNYYKAPDLIGPVVCRALGIPYLQVESTRASKRMTGPWAAFAVASESACDAADAVLYLTERDSHALRRDAPEGQRLIHLHPFLARPDLPAQSDLSGPMLSVGMMRHGDKLGSYALIAQTLKLIVHRDWRLDIVGDGPARDEVAALMAPFGNRVQLRGLQTGAALDAFYAQASLLFWPGVNEAFGLTYLEAQAAGIPVVAQDRDGVRDVVVGGHPSPQDGPAALAGNITTLLDDPAARVIAGAAARTQVAAQHLLPAAARTLTQALQDCAR